MNEFENYTKLHQEKKSSDLDRDTLVDNYNQKNTDLDRDTIVQDSSYDSKSNEDIYLLPQSPPFFVKQQWIFLFFLLAFFCFLLFNFF